MHSIQMKSLLPLENLIQQVSPDLELSYRSELMVNHMAHVLIRGMASLPPTVEQYPEIVLEPRRRNPTLASLEMMVDLTTKPGPFRNALMDRLTVSNVISQSVSNPQQAMTVLEEHLQAAIPATEVIQLYSQYGGAYKARPAFRLGSVAIVDWVLTYILERVSAMARYSPGDFRVTLDQVCTLIKEDVELNYFYQQIMKKPWVKLLKNL